jgi:hypothetical protein
VISSPRHRPDGRHIGEVGEQLNHVIGEGIGGTSSKGTSRRLIAARRSPEAEINPPAMEGLQRSELLGDHQGRVVRQHHPTSSEPNRRGVRSDVGEEDGWS